MDEAKVDEIVRRHFKVIDMFRLEDGYEYVVNSDNAGKAFVSLYRDMIEINALPRLKQAGNNYSLIISQAPVAQASWLKPALIFASLLSLVAYGYWQVGGSYVLLVLFLLPLISLIALHELGRIVASRKWGSMSFSYVIPGIPAIVPIMGFVSSPYSFPINRDQQFDLGFFSIMMALISLVPYMFLGNFLNLASISKPGITIMSYIIGQYINFSNPLISGSLLAFTVAFVNFLPTWQLDGGMMIDSVKSRSLGMDLLSVMLMSLMGYFVFALVIIFVQGSIGFTKPLDTVTPLSNSRKYMYYVLLIVMVIGFLFFAIF